LHRFSALTLLVGQQEGHLACNKTECWGGGMVICLRQGADLHMPSWCHCLSLSLAPVNPDWFYHNGSAFLVPVVVRDVINYFPKWTRPRPYEGLFVNRKANTSHGQTEYKVTHYTFRHTHIRIINKTQQTLTTYLLLW